MYYIQPAHSEHANQCWKVGVYTSQPGKGVNFHLKYAIPIFGLVVEVFFSGLYWFLSDRRLIPVSILYRRLRQQWFEKRSHELFKQGNPQNSEVKQSRAAFRPCPGDRTISFLRAFCKLLAYKISRIKNVHFYYLIYIYIYIYIYILLLLLEKLYPGLFTPYLWFTSTLKTQTQNITERLQPLYG